MLGLSKNRLVPLLEAAAAGDMGRVSRCLHKDVSLVREALPRTESWRHPEFEEGMTALHVAAREGKDPVIEFLISLKADLAAVTARGKTALHLATAKGLDQTVELLLDAKASLEAGDGEGATALHEAVKHRQVRTVKLLLGRGASVEAQDAAGNTPLHTAAAGDSERIVVLLLQHPADPNARNHAQQTPLHMAILGAEHSDRTAAVRGVERDPGALRICELLLQARAQVNALDQLGNTPLDLLSYLDGELADPTMVALLQRYGGKWNRLRKKVPLPQAVDSMGLAVGEAFTTLGGEMVKPSMVDTSLVASASVDLPPAGSAAPGVGRPIPLGSAPILIGRDAGCDVHYRSRTLSRRHARIESTPKGYLLTDLGSHNGTLLNDVPIRRPTVLEPEDVIQLGEYSFRFSGRELIPLTGELSEEALERERAK